MKTISEQVLALALALPEADRLELAEALLAASEPPPPALMGEAWLAELKRRSDDIDAGRARLSSWADVKRRINARLRAHNAAAEAQ